MSFDCPVWFVPDSVSTPFRRRSVRISQLNGSLPSFGGQRRSVRIHNRTQIESRTKINGQTLLKKGKQKESLKKKLERLSQMNLSKDAKLKAKQRTIANLKAMLKRRIEIIEVQQSRIWHLSNKVEDLSEFREKICADLGLNGE